MSRTPGIVCFSAVVISALTLLGCGSDPNSQMPGGSVVAATANPLVAQYTVNHSHPGLFAWIEFGTDTTYGRQTSISSNSIRANNGTSSLSILVAGMKPETTYHMRAHAGWTGGTWIDEDHTFTTGSLPTSSPSILPVISVSHPTPGLSPAPGVELLSIAGPPLTLVTDLDGNIIWSCSIGAIPIKQLPNGNFLLNIGTDLREVDLTCNTVRDISYTQVNQSLQANGFDFIIPPPLGLGGGNPFHHDVLALPNGHWITLCQIAKDFDNLTGISGTTQVVGDALVDIDPDGNVGWAWSSFDHLDVNRHPYFGLPDWTHSNAVVYTADGNLLVSMRHQSWIVKIDYANGSGTGDILWKLGLGGDITLDGGDPSKWFYSQHDPNVVSTSGSVTTLAVYDNGNFRTYSDGTVCGAPSAPACLSRATLFQVDESTGLATLLWEEIPGFFSFWGGSIGLLSNGNIEFDSTEPFNTLASQIMEVSQTNNPQVVWQMNITGQFAYRGHRITSLYPGVTWNH